MNPPRLEMSPNVPLEEKSLADLWDVIYERNMKMEEMFSFVSQQLDVLEYQYQVLAPTVHLFVTLSHIANWARPSSSNFNKRSSSLGTAPLRLIIFNGKLIYFVAHSYLSLKTWRLF